MKLIHTLLFLIRPTHVSEDLAMASQCLTSLEESEVTQVIVFNQGFWNNAALIEYLEQFSLHCIVIGNAENVGTVIGRQRCFEFIFSEMSDIKWISELHLDMVFTPCWERPLIDYLETEDQPLVGCGIVDAQGYMPFLLKQCAPPPMEATELQSYLKALPCEHIVKGFTNPCIHNATILKKTGGYHAAFLKGTQAFEDDSMLLGYYYYYGTKRCWRPRVHFGSVVLHHVAGQRLSISGNTAINYNGLVTQYGAMGLKHLSELHQSDWHRRFFGEKYRQFLTDTTTL